MATFFKKTSEGCLKCISRQLIFTRGRKHNVQHPRPKVWTARVMESISKPIFIEEQIPEWQKCGMLRNVAVEEEIDEYEEFVYKGTKRMFEKNNMILVCQELSMSGVERTRIKNIMIKNGMKYEIHNNKLMSRATTELSEYKNMKPWFIAKSVYITSEEQNVNKAIKLLKKIPDLILLGGLVDKQLYSREGLKHYSQLPNIEQLRGELVSVLNMAAGGKTRSLLESHQQTLCRNLDQYVKQSSEGPNDE